MPEEQARQYQQYIAVGGYYPPIPGFLSPGLYDIDLDARSATLVLPEAESSDTVAEEHAPTEPTNPPISNGG